MSKNHKKLNILPVILIVLVTVCVATVMVWPKLSEQSASVPTTATTVPIASTASGTSVESTTPTESVLPTEPAVTETAPQSATEDANVQLQPQEQMSINLGSGLEITDSGKYTGLYMEDGSNKGVSNVMMVVVCTNGQQDIQFAAFTAVSGAETYRFQLTNLAVGERVVLLDLDQKQADGYLTSAVADQIVLFSEPMSLFENRVQLSGMDGMLNVKNVSATDIHSDIYVYYKYAAQDLYYGGVTFRVRVEGGLKAGETRQVIAPHYTENGCVFVQVMIYE